MRGAIHPLPPYVFNDVAFKDKLHLTSVKFYVSQTAVRGCIQKFPDWLDNEINNKHSLRSNTEGCGGKTH
jgi:hypothetical protein